MTELATTVANIGLVGMAAFGAGVVVLAATWVWWRVTNELVTIFKFKKEFLLWLIQKKRRANK